MAPISGKIIPKEYIKTQNLTNASNFIIQSEPPASKEIMVDNKIRTNLSVLSGVTGASVSLEKRIPIKKKNMKSLAISPTRKDLIPNQDINILRTKTYQSLPPQLAKYCPGYKSLINAAEYGRNYSTDTSCTDKEDSVNNLKAINKKTLMTNTKMITHKTITIMKLLLKN